MKKEEPTVTCRAHTYTFPCFLADDVGDTEDNGANVVASQYNLHYVVLRFPSYFHHCCQDEDADRPDIICLCHRRVAALMVDPCFYVDIAVCSFQCHLMYAQVRSIQVKL